MGSFDVYFDITKKWMITYSTDGKITVLNAQDHNKKNEIELASHDIEKVLCFENNLVISYTNTSKLTIYDFAANLPKEISIPEGEGIATMTRLENDLLIARANGDVELWDSRYQSLKGKTKTDEMISTLNITKHSVVIGSLDGKISLLSVPDFKSQGAFKASKHAIVQVKRTADEITVLDKIGELTTFQLISR